MTTLLLKNATVLATFADDAMEITGGGLFCRNGVILGVGPTAALPVTADVVLDCTGHVVIPGLMSRKKQIIPALKL
jgi:cytosine/adenosine deaminase-related metal-dependent hydrolase